MPLSVRPILTTLILILSVLGLWNVYGDNKDVINEARVLACPDCESTLTQFERTPFGQTFHLTSEKAGVVIIECARSGIFVGEYRCKNKGQ